MRPLVTLGLAVVLTALLAACDTGSALPVSCSADPAPPAEPLQLRLAVGGVGESRLLGGAGGLLPGTFPDRVEVEVEGGEGVLHVFTMSSPGGPVLRVVPLAQAGTGTLTVRATDVCARRVATTIPFEVVNSPTCSVDYDPTSVDYFPLELGLRWTYRIGDQGSAEETWEVSDAGACRSGRRTYTVRRTRGSSTTYDEYTVFGDSLTGLGGSLIGPHSYGTIRRRLPAVPAPPDSLLFARGACGYDCTAVILRRDVGVSYLSRTVRGSPRDPPIYPTFKLTLIEGPTQGRQNATAAWRR